MSNKWEWTVDVRGFGNQLFKYNCMCIFLQTDISMHNSVLSNSKYACSDIMPILKVG